MAKKLFTYANTEEGLTNAINNQTLDSHVVFIKESGKEGICAQNKIYQTIPSNGEDGQILISQNGKGVWKDLGTLDINDVLSYGVEWKPNVADPVLTRVGNMNYHKSLPIQSGMKGCIYNPITKKVVYWLDEDNWTYKKGGNPDKGEVENLARLDGYDGEVMVYVPEFWIKSWDESDRRCVRISPIKIDDTWEHQPALFLSAYKDTLLTSVPQDMGYLSTLETQAAISVANNATYCRGGSNSSANDEDEDIFKSLLGKCRTSISRNNFREYARITNKEIMSYRQYKNILYWLYVIEYANFNSQAAYNSNLTSEGFHQGGLGNGVTGTTDIASYNGSMPITPNGYTNEFGNGTGVKLIEPLGPEPIGSIYAIRWRGIENPFGDTWTNLDGVIVDSQAITKNGTKFDVVYATNDPELYNDEDCQVMDKVGEKINTGGFIKEWNLGSTAEIIPRSTGGTSTQYKCDYQWASSTPALSWMVVGGAPVMAQDQCGLGYIATQRVISMSGGNVGFRTCCIAN